jgi:hypothetical protein
VPLGCLVTGTSLVLASSLATWFFSAARRGCVAARTELRGRDLSGIRLEDFWSPPVRRGRDEPVTGDTVPRWYFPEFDPVGTDLASPEAVAASDRTQERTRRATPSSWVPWRYAGDASRRSRLRYRVTSLRGDAARDGGAHGVHKRLGEHARLHPKTC